MVAWGGIVREPVSRQASPSTVSDQGVSPLQVVLLWSPGSKYLPGSDSCPGGAPSSLLAASLSLISPREQSGGYPLSLPVPRTMVSKLSELLCRPSPPQSGDRASTLGISERTEGEVLWTSGAVLRS